MKSRRRKDSAYMDIRYIELKTGYHDDGPAWIGNVKESKSGRTLYFNNHAFHKSQGISGNYIDIETGEEYWISRPKQNGEDRHWAGHGKVIIDRKCIAAYLALIGKEALPTSSFIIEDIADSYPVERIKTLLNE